MINEPTDFFLFDTPTEPSFDRLTELVSLGLRVPIALVSLVGRDRQFFKSSIGLEEPWASTRETPLSHSFCKYVIGMERPLIIADALAHPLVRHSPAIEDLGIGAYIGHPIHSPMGRVVGAICAIAHQFQSWTDSDARFLEIVAQIVDEEIIQAARRATVH